MIRQLHSAEWIYALRLSPHSNIPAPLESKQEKTIQFREVDQNKREPALLCKLFHKSNLMFMDICNRKTRLPCFFRIKADRNSLHISHIITRTFSSK